MYIRVSRGQGGVKVRSMIDLVLGKKDMLPYVQDVRAVTGMRRGLLDHHVLMRKIRLVGEWIKRREVVTEAWRIISEKPREHQYREGNTMSLEG